MGVVEWEEGKEREKGKGKGKGNGKGKGRRVLVKEIIH